jgi:hypothetical protein
MDELFNSFLLNYDPFTGDYWLADFAYQINMGRVTLTEGPGWIWVAPESAHLPFLDASMAATLSELLDTLNAELPKE